MNYDYKNDLLIERGKLDEECIRHPSLYMKYAEAAIRADSEAKRSKEKQEVLYATLYASARAKKEATGDKFTEKSLESEITIHPEYRAACDNYIAALEEAKILSAAVEAFSQRKGALENVVKLFLAGYFSEPRGKDESNSRAQTQNLNDSMKKRKGQ